MNLATLITKVLAERGLTPLRFTALLEEQGVSVTVQSVGYWLSGERLPRAEYAQAICKALEIDPAVYLDACAVPKEAA